MRSVNTGQTYPAEDFKFLLDIDFGCEAELSTELVLGIINWEELANRSDLPEEFVLKYWPELTGEHDENRLFRAIPLAVPRYRYSEDFAIKFLGSDFSQRFSYIIKNCDLSLEFIEEKLLPAIKRKFKKDKHGLEYLKILICSNQFLTERLIRKVFGRKVREFLTAILRYQQVDEKFLNYYKKFFNQDNWETVFLVQNYSLKFLKKNYFRVSGSSLMSGIGWMRLFSEIPNEIKLYAELRE